MNADQQAKVDATFRRLNFKRDSDGRLKLKGHSKTDKERLMLLLARLTGLSQMNRTELIEHIEQYANETDAELHMGDGQGVSVQDGALQVAATANPELMAVIAEGLLEQMEAAGGSNYVEWALTSSKTGESFTLLLQRRGKKTPAQRFNEVRADLVKILAQRTIPKRDLRDVFLAHWPGSTDIDKEKHG